MVRFTSKSPEISSVMDQMQIHVLHHYSDSLKSPSENLKLQETGAPPHLKVAGEGRIAKNCSRRRYL